MLAVPLAARASSLPQRVSGDGRVTLAIHNPHSRHSRVFAAEAARLGALVFETGHDPARLWFERLRRLDLTRLRLAGLAPYSDFRTIADCILGWQDIDTLYEGVHEARAGGKPKHAVVCGAVGLNLENALPASGPDWPVALAQALVANGPSFRPPERMAWFFARRPAYFPEGLASWLMA
jgi:hypothetical protein